jgi:hypothetical protein
MPKVVINCTDTMTGDVTQQETSLPEFTAEAVFAKLKENCLDVMTQAEVDQHITMKAHGSICGHLWVVAEDTSPNSMAAIFIDAQELV